MLKEKNHEHCHTTSNDIWSGDVVTYNISERETGCGTKKYGEVNAEHHLERQDQEWSSKIKDASEGHHQKSTEHERPVGRTSCWNKQQQVGSRKQWNGHQEREAGRKEGLSGGGETTSKRKPEECGPRVAQDRQVWKQLWRPPASSGMTGWNEWMM